MGYVYHSYVREGSEMRASVRCKSHHQGDKCRLELNHTGNCMGAFAEWNVKGVVRTTTISVPRSRYANRIVRGYANRAKAGFTPTTPEHRKAAISALTKAIHYFRRTP